MAEEDNTLTFSKEDVQQATPRKAKHSGLAQLLSSAEDEAEAAAAGGGLGSALAAAAAAAAAEASGGPAEPPAAVASVRTGRRPSVLVYSCRVFVRPGRAVQVATARGVSADAVLAAVGAGGGARRLAVARETGEEDDEFPRLDGQLPVHHFGVRTFCVLPPLEKVGGDGVAAEAKDGAEQQEPTVWVGSPEAGGVSPDPVVRLLEAADKGDVEAVIDLLEQSVDVNSRGPGGWKALHLAARGGHLAVVGYLIKNAPGLDPDSRTDGGLTALQVCAQRGHYDVAELLLIGGADPAGAADSAAEFEHDDVAELAAEFAAERAAATAAAAAGE